MKWLYGNDDGADDDGDSDGDGDSDDDAAVMVTMMMVTLFHSAMLKSIQSRPKRPSADTQKALHRQSAFHRLLRGLIQPFNPTDWPCPLLWSRYCIRL